MMTGRWRNNKKRRKKKGKRAGEGEGEEEEERQVYWPTDLCLLMSIMYELWDPLLHFTDSLDNISLRSCETGRLPGSLWVVFDDNSPRLVVWTIMYS
jgi:hypothetical protein